MASDERYFECLLESDALEEKAVLTASELETLAECHAVIRAWEDANLPF